MNANTPLQCAPAIHLGVRSDRDVRIRLPGRCTMRGDQSTLAILAAFSSSRSLQEGLEQLGDRVTSVEQWASLATRVLKLRKAGFLQEASQVDLLASGQRFDAPSVHIRMLNDRARTSSFQQAIREQVAKGDIVLDIGTGTGILAATAAQSGAEHVYAIEQSSMADIAARFFAANGLSDRITVIRGYSTDIEIPQRANVLVSEILGNDPLAEGILHVTADAIDRHLKPDAKFIPRSVDLYAIPYSIPTEHLQRRVFLAETAAKWQAWYGLDFSPLVEASQSQNHVMTRNTYEMRDWVALSEPVHLTSIDLKTSAVCKTSEVSTGRSGVRALRDGDVSGILVYFDADLSDHIRLSIHPENATPENSWSSHVFVPGRPVELREGDEFALKYRYAAVGSEFEIQRC